MNITFKQKVTANVIFTYDDRPQELLDFETTGMPIDDKYEAKLIRDLISQVSDSDTLNKVSIALGCNNKDFIKLPIVKKIFSRNGKYFFQPNQRGDIENEIIEGTEIASLTKNFEE